MGTSSNHRRQSHKMKAAFQMSANRKLILIIFMGVGACLLSFVISQYYSSKNHTNQLLLDQVQRISGRVGYIRLLSKNFVQNGDQTDWQNIIRNLEFVDLNLEAVPPLIFSGGIR